MIDKIRKIEINDVYAMMLLAMLAVGVWQFVPKSTLPSFEAAGMIKESLAGGQAPHYISFATACFGIFSAAASAPAGPEAIVSFLLILGPVLLALSCAAIYISLRLFAYGKRAAWLVSALIATSLSALAFLPGIYIKQQIGFFTFSLFLLAFAAFESRGRNFIALAASALLAAAVGYFGIAFAIAGALAAMFFAYRNRKSAPYMHAILVVAFAAGVALSGSFLLNPTLENFVNSVSYFAPFILALAMAAAAFSLMGAIEIEWFAFTIAGALLLFVEPLAGVAALALPSAAAIKAAMSDGKKEAHLLSIGALGFFLLLPLSLLLIGGYQAIMITALIALAFPLLLHLYNYRNQEAFTLCLAAIFACSIFFALFIQVRPAAFYPQYTDSSLSDALLKLSALSPSSVIVEGHADAAKFYLPGANIISGSEADGFFLEGNGSHSGAYVVSSPETISALSAQGGFDAYYYFTNYSSSSRNFAAFASTDGTMISAEVTQTGSLALKDGKYIDRSGQTYGTIPLSRMILLSSSDRYDANGNMLLVINEGSKPPFATKLYSGSASATLALKSGPTYVFLVK